MFSEILLVVALVLIVYNIYKWTTKNDNYFESRNLKYIKLTLKSVVDLICGKYTLRESLLEGYNSIDEP